MHRSLVLLPILGLSVSAQSLNATGLIQALQGAGLTGLASAAALANQTEAGQSLIQALVSGNNYTVFAPNNAAFQAPAVAAITDADTIAAILAYHVLPGSYANATDKTAELQSGVAPSVTVGRSVLTNSSFVNLEGGKGQVCAWTRNNASSPIYFLDQTPENTVLSTIAVGNLLVATISGVLIPPGNLSTVAVANNLTMLATVGTTVSIPDFYGNGTSATVVEALESSQTKGFTLFAPDNAALTAASSALASLANNQTALLTLLGAHYINGTSYYSPELLGASGDFISASGQTLKFSSNSTGAYVTTQTGSEARIVKSDVLVENGVVHIIDGVLVNLNSNPAAASSAYNSATSVAGQSTTQTGPVGPTSTSTGSGSGSGGKNGALSVRSSSTVAGVALGLALFMGLVL
ncbi:hypothetical protein H0H81_011239 [Sphagnurus paluster]|uniref:FAS1 domain-containing protein n=1 Tax=Sphagnurus paluster TaxID=117069 RepID=A0A9P7K534_9AGAR|nr:hypothetical protein H0H81_011239 [Sphagnurus paluster]